MAEGLFASDSLVERYRTWYAHERWADAALLDMIDSVPAEHRGDPRFARVLTLAAHLIACRENYLEMMQDRPPSVEWWPENVDAASLRPRYARVEAGWTAFLDSLVDETLTADFAERGGGDDRYRWNVEGQSFQLLGHAWYHRGQISLLVEQLGGTTVDTDYVEWVFATSARYGKLM